MRKVLRTMLLLCLAAMLAGVMTQACTQREAPQPATTTMRTEPTPKPPPTVFVDAMIYIKPVGDRCRYKTVDPDPVRVHQGESIRWGISSECEVDMEVEVEIELELDSFAKCDLKTTKNGLHAAKPLFCQVKDGLLGEGEKPKTVEYVVKVGGSSEDPQIQIRP